MAFFVELRLVTERDRTQGENRLTGGVHIRDILLVAARGALRGQQAGDVDRDVPTNAGRGVVNGCDAETGAADLAQGVKGSISNKDASRDIIEPGMPDANLVKAVVVILAGLPTERDVAVAAVQVHKRLVADRGVAEACRVREERLVADRGVSRGTRVTNRCLVTNGRVVIARVRDKRTLPDGGVAVARLIRVERHTAQARVVVADRIGVEGLESDGDVVEARGV